ncbi:hypothetical protein JW868_05055 [Candidatus Woesearchaeota archaeon]|nr:hypothetical protein [Candidatus Woesearchaeota archaeon]
MAVDISYTLSYYKRKDVAEAIAGFARQKEIGVFFGERFGKRPDVITYPNDVLSFAQRRASSFHCSEERWSNPLLLYSGISRKEMDEIREGWDFILDIDCPHWDFSRIITNLFVKAIKEHGVNSVTVKFSGNKGFHIGVAFEAFPKTINDVSIKDLFPEGPRRLASYLLDYTRNYVRIKPDSVSFDNKEYSFEDLQIMFGVSNENMFPMKCVKCGKSMPKTELNNVFTCPYCGNSESRGEEDHKICSKCGKIIKPSSPGMILCACGSKEFRQFFNPLSIVEVDTVLIAPRHMYRMPYSLHEKSGLVSVPFSTKDILTFEKNSAKPENIEFNHVFLNQKDTVKGEAADLLVRAFDFNPDVEDPESVSLASKKKYEIPDQAISEEFFPPCIKKILLGLEDGRKRSLFILLNFLRNVGWTYENIQDRLVEWNKLNKEPLRETVLKGHVRYHRQVKKSVLPPNCRGYYEELRVCLPNGLCQKIKNPVSYSKIMFDIKNKKKTRSRVRHNKQD